jgi:tetratricopeptide (TPR) repeat protein
LEEEAWHRGALLGLAELEYRRASYEDGLGLVNRALQLDAYDGTANFLAGNLYRALGRVADARDAYGWAARSTAHRSASYVSLAELMLAGRGLAGGSDTDEATRYAAMALDYDRFNLPAREILAMVGRMDGDSALVEVMHREMLEIDPLHHFVAAERYLAAPSDESRDDLVAGLRSEYPDQSLLELSIDYIRRGRPADATAILLLGSERMANPLLRAWAAWIESDESALAGGVDPELVFPYRPETLPVLRWASEHGDHWSWDYLLGLNLWAMDRRDEAAEVLGGLGDAPDLGSAYVARASLLQAVLGTDPEADLRRAAEIGGRDRAGGRVFRVSLVQHLQAEGRWEEALAEATRAASIFQADFNLDLLRVKSLIQLGRPDEAIQILDQTHVLPSENARESHRLFEQAHTLAAIASLGSGDLQKAQHHLTTALTWPEHLGQGRPYDPEERLPQYLLGRIADRLEDRAGARTAFEAVVTATEREAQGSISGPLDLLTIPSLMALGRSEDLQHLSTDPDTEAGRIARTLLDGILSGTSLYSLAPQVATDHQDLFAGLEGGFLLFALLIEP